MPLAITVHQPKNILGDPLFLIKGSLSASKFVVLVHKALGDGDCKHEGQVIFGKSVRD